MVEAKSTEPVSSQEVYQALYGASSQNPDIVQASSKLLQGYQERPGTYNQLHMIAAERNNVPLDVRRMAIIQFKNGVMNVWRNKRLFNDDIRASIRERAMAFLYEEDNIVADCSATIVAKISRTDVPAQWPSLIPELTALIQSQIQVFLSNPTGAHSTGALPLKRALHVLDQVIKEFSTMKMPHGIRTMAQVAESLYSPLISHYDQLSTLLKDSLTVEALLNIHLHDICEEIVQLCHLIFKPCTRIMLWLWQKTNQAQFHAALDTLSTFSQSCFQLAPALFDLRMQLMLKLRQVIDASTADVASSTSVSAAVTNKSSKTLYMLTKHLLLYGKMFRRMQRLAIRRFVILPHANELVLFYWGEVVKATSGPPEAISDSYDAVYPTRLLVQAMMLFRESLNVWSGKGNHETITEVLSQQFVEEAVKLLLRRLIPLAPTDLEHWMINPEEWVKEEEWEEDAWEYELRPCAERVLITLCTHYHVFVIPLLLENFQAVLAVPSDSLSSILQKEAVYCAIGRCAHKLSDKLDFDGWLNKQLVFEAQKTNPDFRIVKRRIAWVIGKWYADPTNPQLKPQVWEVLRHLMHDRGQSSDPVVRLSAAEALRECVDTVGFEAHSFQPFLGDFVTELIRSINDSDILESKNRLIKTLSTIIERVESLIVPFIKVIVDPLPDLWRDAGDAILLKATLIVMITHLIGATREYSSEFSHVTVSLVQESFAPKIKLQLDQDGLNLWAAALRNAVVLESTRDGVLGYIEMFPHALLLLSENLDLLGSVIKIVESYLILDANRVLTMYGRDLFRAIASVMPKAVGANLKNVILTINLVIQVAPASLWAEPMHSSGLFAMLAKAVIDDKDPAQLLAEHIYVLARISLSDPLILNQLLAGAAPALGLPETQVFEGLLDQWWSKFDSMAEPRHRKLVAMGIANWVSTARPEVLGRLHTEIFNLWLDVFGELKEALADEDARSPLILFWRNSADQSLTHIPDNVENTLEADRRRQMYLRDPIITEKLTIYVKEKLQQAEGACGTQIFHTNYLEKADPTVLGQLKAELLTGN